LAANFFQPCAGQGSVPSLAVRQFTEPAVGPDKRVLPQVAQSPLTAVCLPVLSNIAYVYVVSPAVPDPGTQLTEEPSPEQSLFFVPSPVIFTQPFEHIASWFPEHTLASVGLEQINLSASSSKSAICKNRWYFHYKWSISL